MFVHNLSVIVRYHRIYCERQLAAAGYELGYPEQSVLLMLSAYSDINQDFIARHLMIDKGAITKTLVKLEDKNLVKRWENPDNKREKLLLLTESGKNLIEKIEQVLKTWDDLLAVDLSAEDLSQLDKLTSTLTQNAIQIIKKGDYSWN